MLSPVAVGRVPIFQRGCLGWFFAPACFFSYLCFLPVWMPSLPAGSPRQDQEERRVAGQHGSRVVSWEDVFVLPPMND